MVFSPDGRLLATGGDDETVRLWDPTSGAQSALLPGHTSRVRAVDFHPDGRLLASGSADGMVRVWDVLEGWCLTVLRVSGGLSDVAWHPRGDLLAAGGERGLYVLTYVS